jgi:hypothetical protein
MTPAIFRIALLVLSFAVAVLVSLLTDFRSVRPPSIGGGGYSLDRFVYSGLLLLLTGMSAFGAFCAALVCRERASANRAFTVAAVAFGGFLISAWFYGANLR